MSALTIALVCLVGLILVGWFCTSMWTMKKTTSCPAATPKPLCDQGLHKQGATHMMGDNMMVEPMVPVSMMAGGPSPAWGGSGGRSTMNVFGPAPPKPMLSGTSGGGFGAYEFGDGLANQLPQNFGSDTYMAKGGMKYGMGPMAGDGTSRRAPGVVGKNMSLAEMAGKRGSAKFIEKTRTFYQSREGEKIGKGKGIRDTGMRALTDGLRGYTRPSPKSRIAHSDRVFRVQEGQHEAVVGPPVSHWVGVPAAAGRNDNVPAPVAYESL